jgi:hypothetical protein
MRRLKVLPAAIYRKNASALRVRVTKDRNVI